MSNTNMRALKTGGAENYLAYVKDSQGNDQRVKHVFSNLVSDPQHIGACVNELKMFAGTKYDAIACRDSFAEGDNLDESQAREYTERFVSEYLGDRPYYAVWHGDTQNQHVHVVAGFLDAEGRALNFRGRRAHAEGVRRMEIADKLADEFKLKKTPREPGRYTRARDRRPIAVERLRDSDRYAWTDDLKARIKTASESAKDRAEFIAMAGVQGVGVRYRGSGVSYDFQDSDGKKRTARGRKLGTDFMPFVFDSDKRKPGGDDPRPDQDQPGL